MALRLFSSAFSNNGMIPIEHTCDGSDVSPELSWEGVPNETRSLALICEDPDAPGGIFTHWVVFNITPQSRGFPRGLPKQENMPRGGRQGLNDFGGIGYGGPCPPQGEPHRYFFRIFALDRELDLKPGPSKADLMQEIRGHITSDAELVGLFAR